MIKDFIEKYENYLKKIDEKCNEVFKNIQQIPCWPNCKDDVVCCKQIFPLSFIEAYYLSLGFHKLPKDQRREIEKNAKIAAKVFTEDFEFSNIPKVSINTSYETHSEIQKKYTNILHSAKIKCPFLSETLCSVYSNRNFDCRLHGFAYDRKTKQILGCHLHAEIFKTNDEFEKFGAENDLLYAEKIKLDGELISFIAGNEKFKNVRYLTNPFTPILKNFENIDWKLYFNQTIKPQDIQSGTYSLILD